MYLTFILSSLWLSGGVRVIVECANRLTQRGHQVTLVTPGGTVDPDITNELLPTVKIQESRVKRQSQLNAWQAVQLNWSLAQAVPSSDIVISTHTPTTVAGFIAAHILKNGQPIWLYQDYREMFIDRPYEDWLMRHALRWHKAALVVSEYSRQELNRYAPGQVIVIQEGLSHADIFKPLSDQAHRNETDLKHILFFGDMRPRKGLFDFLDAVHLLYQKLRNINLWIVSKSECQIESDVPFEFIYRPSRAEQAHLYATCDLFVSASWWESFGLPPLEAMACGAPVVMTDSRGGREYARHEENCLMVPPRQPNLLAKAMYRVLTDPILADRLKVRGPQTAEKFDWSATIDRFEAALEDAVDS